MSESDDYEYEECTVVVELQGILETDFLKNVKQAKMLGVDTDKPLLQLDDYTFTGEYQDSLGTIMVLEESNTQSPDGIAENNKKSLEFHSLTSKKLSVERVFLKKLDEEASPSTTTGPPLTPTAASSQESAGLPGSATTSPQKNRDSGPDVTMETEDT